MGLSEVPAEPIQAGHHEDLDDEDQDVGGRKV
jgi:hypothetical protein